jgi:hypothetical protein
MLSVGGEAAAEEGASLSAWLAEEGEFGGRVQLAERAPAPGTMGALPELVVALGPGGAATAFAGAVVAWIRRRSGSTTVTVKRAAGVEISLSADHVRGLTTEQLGALVERLAAALDAGSADG